MTADCFHFSQTMEFCFSGPRKKKKQLQSYPSISLCCAVVILRAWRRFPTILKNRVCVIFRRRHADISAVALENFATMLFFFHLFAPSIHIFCVFFVKCLSSTSFLSLSDWSHIQSPPSRSLWISYRVAYFISLFHDWRAESKAKPSINFGGSWRWWQNERRVSRRFFLRWNHTPKEERWAWKWRTERRSMIILTLVPEKNCK